MILFTKKALYNQNRKLFKKHSRILNLLIEASLDHWVKLDGQKIGQIEKIIVTVIWICMND